MKRLLLTLLFGGLIAAMAAPSVCAAPNIGIQKDWFGYADFKACDDVKTFIIYNEGDGVLEG